MKCEYSDGFKIDFSGSLRITKDEDINVFVKKRAIPTTVVNALRAAVRNNNCDELREAALKATDAIGGTWKQ